VLAGLTCHPGVVTKASGLGPEGEAMKRCTKCGETKPSSEFHKDSGRPDGLYIWCKDCQRAKSKAWREANADKHKASVKAWRKANRERARAYDKAWLAKNPDKQREYLERYRTKNPEQYERVQRSGHLRRTYGLTIEDYDAMLDAQGGVCALCGAEPSPKRRLCVDHCHSTGAIRQLLCQRCNRTLGLFDDDPGWFTRAAEYLERHSTPRT
jgi:hypothetical protein